MTAIVTIRQQDTDHHFAVGDAQPDQMAVDLREAIAAMADPKALDMGDLAAAFCATLREGYGAAMVRLLPGGHPARYYDSKVRWHYVVTKPERGIRIEAKQVMREDKKQVAITHWSGLFTDFERQIKTITRNITHATERRKS